MKLQRKVRVSVEGPAKPWEVEKRLVEGMPHPSIEKIGDLKKKIELKLIEEKLQAEAFLVLVLLTSASFCLW